MKKQSLQLPESKAQSKEVIPARLWVIPLIDRSLAVEIIGVTPAIGLVQLVCYVSHGKIKAQAWPFFFIQNEAQVEVRIVKRVNRIVFISGIVQVLPRQVLTEKIDFQSTALAF